MNTNRPIVITPYYKENASLLKRCIASVRSQTVPSAHLLVADGFAQDWIDSEGVRHLRLDSAHADYGNTPRGVGAVLAAAEGFSPIAMLDADNWLEPDHMEVCLAAGRAAPGGTCDFIVARRCLRRPDGSKLTEGDEPISEHVDTNCFLFFPGAFHMLAHWALMPRQLSEAGDRVFWAAIRTRGLVGVQISDRVTVNYHCMWADVYRDRGETPPAGARPDVDFASIGDWIKRLNDRDREVASRLCGVPLTSLR